MQNGGWVEENPWKVEESNKNLEKSKRKNKQDLHEFISVMKSVAGYNILQHDEDMVKDNKKCCFSSRSYHKKNKAAPARLKSSQRRKRAKIEMEFSTPTKLIEGRREVETLTPPDVSPVRQENMVSPRSDCPSFHINPDQHSPTGNTLLLDGANLTLTKRVDTSAQIEGGANDLFDAAMKTEAFSKSFHGGRRQQQAPLNGMGHLNRMMEDLDVSSWSEFDGNRATSDPSKGSLTSNEHVEESNTAHERLSEDNLKLEDGEQFTLGNESVEVNISSSMGEDLVYKKVLNEDESDLLEQSVEIFFQH